MTQDASQGPDLGPSQGPIRVLAKGQSQAPSPLASHSQRQGLCQGSSQGLDQGPSRIAMHPTAAPTRVKSVTWGDLPEVEEEQPAQQMVYRLASFQVLDACVYESPAVCLKGTGQIKKFMQLNKMLTLNSV